MTDRGNVWYCKIGFATLPEGGGADSPMRQAVERAYRELTDEAPEFIFSGWGQQLDEAELACVEDRLPDPEVVIQEERKKIDDAVVLIDSATAYAAGSSRGDA